MTSFAKRFLSEFVKVHEGESAQNLKNLYSAVGLPGATGSMDCTHLWWNKCTESLKHLCNGKEKHPSLAFCALVDHFRYIQYVSLAYFGAANDIQILEADEFCRNLLWGSLKDYEYEMILEDGTKNLCKGGWVIVDGGMPQASVFINPMHERLSHDAIHWSEWLETVRKDVECAFGILKQRFRILLNRLEFHDRDIIESIFHTCCILHNMLLIWDGKDLDEMMDERYWENMDPDAEDVPDITSHVQSSLDAKAIQKQRFQTVQLILLSLETSTRATRQYDTRIMGDYSKLREDLVASFSAQYKNGLICKPTNARTRKTLHNVLSRVEIESNFSLVVKDSTFIRTKIDGSLYDMGLGLFAGIEYKSGNKICYFRGELVLQEVYDQRENHEYGVAMGVLVLDCYEHVRNGCCKASRANSPVGCFSSSDKTKRVKANAEISINYANHSAYLKATKTIHIGEEISWEYTYIDHLHPTVDYDGF